MYTGLEGLDALDQWAMLLPFTQIVTWYFLLAFVFLFLLLLPTSRYDTNVFIWFDLLKFLVAQIKKAIADAESGNVIGFATGKVKICSIIITSVRLP